MNILFLDQFSEMGGAQQCLLDLLPAIHEQRWRSHVAAPTGGPLLDRARALGATADPIRCGPYTSGAKSMRDIARFLTDFRPQVRGVEDLIRRYSIDLLYVNGPRLVPAACRAALQRVPVLFHCHSRLRPVHAWLAGRALRRAHATLVANCRFTAEPLRAWVVAEDIHIVYNGSRPAPSIGPQPRTANPPAVGIIGRIAPEKGQADFLRAAAAVPGCRFVICGDVLLGDARYGEEVRRLARGLPIEFLGWREDVGSVLASLDVVVVPSAPHEATTRVIFEAYAAGVPVVAYPSGGIPEIVIDGETGFLVNPPTPSALADKLRGLVADPQKLRRAALAAKTTWAQRFTMEHYRRQIIGRIAAAAALGEATTSSSAR